MTLASSFRQSSRDHQTLLSSGDVHPPSQSSSLSGPKPIDALLKPKPGKKKKSVPALRRHNRKLNLSTLPPDNHLPTNTHNGSEESPQADEDDLLERLLNQSLEPNSASDHPHEPLVSSANPPRRKPLISQKLHGLGEDIKEVALAITSSISPPSTASAPPSSNSATLINNPHHKRNRQKERLARRHAKEEAVRESARVEVLKKGPDADERQRETDGISQICDSLGLQIVGTTPDGHCLFSAIADQLNFHDIPNGPHTFQECRRRASDYMRSHPDEFIHYLPATDNGLSEGLMSIDQYEAYCDRIRDTAQWGGEPEIMALSKCFQLEIHVVQANQPMLKISSESASSVGNQKHLTISYHRKSYGLGEHYNSLRTI